MTAQEKAELIMQSLPEVNLSQQKKDQIYECMYTLKEAGYRDDFTPLEYYKVVCMVLSGGYKEEFRL